jgi:hypothetical protein
VPESGLLGSVRGDRGNPVPRDTFVEASKKPIMAPKPGSPVCPGKSMEETYLLSMWCPVCRRRDPAPGSRTELENLTGDVKGKGTSGETTRPKVLMHRLGADCLVVVMKWGNAHGAKGAGHSRRDRRVNGRPEEPVDVGGRRQPSWVARAG